MTDLSAPETRISLSRPELDRLLEALALAPASKALDADLWPKLVKGRGRVSEGRTLGEVIEKRPMTGEEDS